MNASTKMKRLGNNPYCGLKPVSYIAIIMAIIFVIIMGWMIWSTISKSLDMGNMELQKFEELQNAEAQTRAEFEEFLKK